MTMTQNRSSDSKYINKRVVEHNLNVVYEPFQKSFLVKDWSLSFHDLPCIWCKGQLALESRVEPGAEMLCCQACVQFHSCQLYRHV